MIKANRQLIPDRQLFNNLHKHHHISQMHCEPHIPTNPRTPTILNNPQNSISTDNSRNSIMKQFQYLMEVIGNMEELLEVKIGGLESRVDQINMYTNRMRAIIKFRKSSRLYSFANSPNSKHNDVGDGEQEEVDRGSDREYRRVYNRSNVPDSATKYNYQSKQKQGERYLSSTQPKTRQKQPQNPQPEYFTQTIQTLHNEIHHLKTYIQQTHPKTYPSSPIYNTQSASKLQQSISKYQQEIQPDSFQDRIRMNNTVQRYRAITLQYQKQEVMMKEKIGRYRNCLYEILGWLRNMRQVELPAYMPCQACRLKIIINQYLAPSTSTLKTHPQKPTHKTRLTSQQHKTKLSHGELSKIVNNYSDLYDELQSMHHHPATQINQNHSDKDSLLMEYDIDIVNDGV